VAADTRVAVLLDHLPAPPLGDLSQGGNLVIDGLLISRYPHVDRGALLHDSPPIAVSIVSQLCTESTCFLDKHQGQKAPLNDNGFLPSFRGFSVHARNYYPDVMEQGPMSAKGAAADRTASLPSIPRHLSSP